MNTINVRSVQGTAPVATMADAPGLPREIWDGIAQKITEHGTYRPPDYRIPATMALQSIRGVPDGTRVADYANLWGYKDPDGQFYGLHATFVSEDWVVSDVDGNFHIDQWIHRMEMDGTHSEATHVTMVQTPDRTVLEHNTEWVPVTDPRASQNLKKLGALWSEFTPSFNEKVADRLVAQPSRGMNLAPIAPSALQLQPPTP